jgi:hypothetical protein
MNNDTCLICLSECNTYIILNSCLCRIITHENCFNDYTRTINSIKCLICKKHNTHTNCTYIYDVLIHNLFFFFQNLYFYVDYKFFSNYNILFRVVFSVLYHSILLAILSNIIIFSYIILYNTNKIYKIIRRIVYKEYNVYKL